MYLSIDCTINGPYPLCLAYLEFTNYKTPAAGHRNQPTSHDGHILQITLISESFLQKTELEVRHPHEFPHYSLHLTRHFRILDKRELGKHIRDCLLP